MRAIGKAAIKALPAAVLIPLFWTTPAWAEINKAKFEETCRGYALEDKVSPDEMEAYIQQCVQDLMEIRSQEETLPPSGDVPEPPAD